MQQATFTVTHELDLNTASKSPWLTDQLNPKIIPVSSNTVYEVVYNKQECELRCSGKIIRGKSLTEVIERIPFTDTTHRYFRDKPIIAEYWVDSFAGGVFVLYVGGTAELTIFGSGIPISSREFGSIHN